MVKTSGPNSKIHSFYCYNMSYARSTLDAHDFITDTFIVAALVSLNELLIPVNITLQMLVMEYALQI